MAALLAPVCPLVSASRPAAGRQAAPRAALSTSLRTPAGRRAALGARRARCQPAAAALRARVVSAAASADPFDTVSVAEGQLLLQAGHTYLDVRTAEEFAASHVPQSVNVPVMLSSAAGMVPNPAFLSEVQRLLPDTSEPLLVGCKSGVRSVAACKLLHPAKYAVKNVGGGFTAWAAAGLPTAK